jgi:hypothetical protein
VEQFRQSQRKIEPHPGQSTAPKNLTDPERLTLR